eukprot:TRINITY_DN2152_c0_g1_i1.p1 TRINITY_DN2152_c0_g1~~TRINITY_DN2152_c0_g1_i1.p1  ORF type:complete len:105 (+),score=17.81 TRINITY_DN2152_c0_g1_i1:122-436(+)
MPAPFVRLLVNLAASSATVVGKAFVDAYKQASAEGGVVSSVKRMPLKEAWQILGVAEDAPKEDVEKTYQRMFDANNPEKGGSFYVQSKIFRAKEAIERAQQNKA